jgi:hypothetical protein
VLVAGLAGGHRPAHARPPATGIKRAQLRLGPARTEAQLVDYASRSAAAAPDVLPGPKDWVYVKTEVAASSAGGGGFLFGPPNRRVVRQGWIRVDWREYAGFVHGRLMISPGNGATLGGWKSVSPAYLNSLPSGPAKLEAIMVASNSNPRMPWYVGRSRADAIFTAIYTLMSDQSDGVWIPPKLDAAMYRILASLPGVHFDPATDLAGRPGMGFYKAFDGWYKQELVIDPATYACMGDETVAIKAHTAVATDGTRYIKKGQVLGWEALLRIAVVRRAGQIP